MPLPLRPIPDWQHPAALVPAAGGAVRFGEPKLVLPFVRRPLVRRVVGVLLAAGCRPVIVVVRPDDPGVRAALHGPSRPRVSRARPPYFRDPTHA